VGKKAVDWTFGAMLYEANNLPYSLVPPVPFSCEVWRDAAVVQGVVAAVALLTAVVYRLTGFTNPVAACGACVDAGLSRCRRAVKRSRVGACS
jgi:hypothetical protein